MVLVFTWNRWTVSAGLFDKGQGHPLHRSCGDDPGTGGRDAVRFVYPGGFSPAEGGKEGAVASGAGGGQAGSDNRLSDRPGIDRPLLESCINHRLLYESAEYHNAVFVGYDPAGKARYAAIRGTVGSYKGETSGSNKRYAFSLCPPRQPPTVHVFESAIDLLSYATLEHRAGRDWRGDALLSLAGVFQRKREKVLPVALKQFLEDRPSVKTVYLHLDNDAVGRSAAQGIIDALADSPYQVIDEPPTHGKDVNDQLCWELQTKEKEHER